jgi:hypothetical protein
VRLGVVSDYWLEGLAKKTKGEKMTTQTATDLYEAINAVLPNAIFDEDSSGEIIIATGFRFSEDGTTLEKVGK